MAVASIRVRIRVVKPLGCGLRLWLAQRLFNLGMRLAEMDLPIHVEAD